MGIFACGNVEINQLKAWDPIFADAIDKSGRIESAVNADFFSAVVHRNRAANLDNGTRNDMATTVVISEGTKNE